MIRAILFDLDGVVRHFDPDFVAAIEARCGIADGLIHASAFSSPILQQVTTGRMRRSQWVEVVGECVGSLAAAEEWGRQIPWVDDEVVALADALRGCGYLVAMLTNGTDTIPEEVRALGLDGHFDAIFNSAEIGFAKPDVRAFRHVLDSLDLDGSEVFFTDDSATHLEGAEQVGMAIHHFQGLDGLRRALSHAGIRTEDSRAPTGPGAGP